MAIVKEYLEGSNVKFSEIEPGSEFMTGIFDQHNLLVGVEKFVKTSPFHGQLLDVEEIGRPYVEPSNAGESVIFLRGNYDEIVRICQ